MKTFAIAALVASTQALSEIESSFLGYISQFGKTYSTMAEYEHRLHQFAQKTTLINEHNATESSYKLGYNQFSDWTQEEYEAILTLQSEGNHVATDDFDGTLHPLAASPKDWRNSGCVNAIKDQGQCGSCWAFSTQSAMESAHCIKTGKLDSFSEQELVDCDTTCSGCNGGLQSRAYRWLESHYEMSESSYRYTARDGSCKYSSSNNTGVKCTGYHSVTADDPTAMKNALAGRPLSVSIQANKYCFQSYSSGIFDDTSCGTRLDHATNVVGWGEEGSTEYWIMRNSWGKSWGENGYMKLKIVSGKGICGIQMEPQYPTTN